MKQEQQAASHELQNTADDSTEHYMTVTGDKTIETGNVSIVFTYNLRHICSNSHIGADVFLFLMCFHIVTCP